MTGVAAGRTARPGPGERPGRDLVGRRQPPATPWPAASDLEARLCKAALACVARAGLSGMSVDDVAEEAGCSRATVYRAFPGGKEALVRALARTEVDAAFAAVAQAVAGAADLEEALVAALLTAARTARSHPALCFLIEHEPEVLTCRLGFRGLEEALVEVRRRGAALFRRFLSEPQAGAVAEWLYRILVSYLACPAEGVDLTEEASVRHLVARFVLPGVRPAEPLDPDRLMRRSEA